MIEGLQQANISLDKGIVRTPSLGVEGELSECVNLIPHAGEIVRIKEPQSIGLELQEGELLLATNRCEGEENFIVRKGNTLAYYRLGKGSYDITDLEEGDVEVITIGNTLIVYQGLSKKYYLWKENTYKEQDLIGAVPNVEFLLGDVLKYKIKNEEVSENKYKTTWGWRPPYEPGIAGWSHTPGEDGYINFYRQAGDTVEETEQAITELYTSLIAHYVETRKKFKDQGMHCFPFYVRWGVKLYDDSIINLSPPMIVMPTSILRPSFGICGVPIGENGGKTTKYDPYNIYTTPLLSPRYFYAAIDASKMKDVDPKLVKGIVVYATPEIEVADLDYFTYAGLRERGGGNWKPIQAPLEDGLGIRHTAINNTVDNENSYYFNYILTIQAKEDVDASAFSSPVEFYELATIPLPVLKKHGYKMFLSLSNGQILDQNFTEGFALSPYIYYYKPDSVYEDLIKAGYKPYRVGKTVLSTLTSQKALASDSVLQQNYDVVQAKDTFVYNERLFYGGVAIKNTANISRNAFLVDSRTKELRSQYANDPAPGIYIQVGESYLTLEDTGPYLNGFKGEIPFLAVPFENATAIGFKTNSFETYEPLSLQGDSLSDCAQWSNITSDWLKEKNDLKELFLLTSQATLDEKWFSNNYATLPYDKLKLNAVAYTKVATPWVIEKMVELACEEIYALSSSTEAVSEGQFGQFPVFVFTNRGIYTLSISDEGEVTAKQAISRDILSSGSKVLQLDHALLFPTEAGLKMLSKPPTTLISGAISGPNVDETIFDLLGGLGIPGTLPFEEQIQNARMVYDYAHQMVHIFPAPPGSGEDDGGGTTTPPEGGDDGGDDGGGDTPTPPEGGDDGGDTGNGGNTTPSEDNEDIEGEVEILSKPRLSVDVDVEWTDDSTIKVLGTVPAGTEKTDPTVMRLTQIMAVKEGEVAVWYQDAPDKTLMEIYVATCTEADLREGRILALLHKKLPVKSDGLRFTYKPSVDCIVFWFADMDNWELKRPAMANVVTPELWPYEIEIKSYDINNYQVVAVVPRGSDQVDADAYRYPYVIPEVQEGDIITWTFDEPRTSNANAYILYGTIDDVTVGFLSPLRYCIGQATDDTNTVYQATADKTGPLIWRFEHATVTITRKAPTSASTFSLRRTISTEAETEGPQKHYVYDLTSGQWATQILNEKLTTVVPGYPFSTMQFGTQLMQYTNEQEVDVIKQGWLLTRPISFSDPFTRKMLADIRLLGQKTHQDTKFKVQVYISEDRVNWHRLTSLKGRSAKWYRFLIKADMCGLDTLTGITCQYVPRLGNKLR